MKHNMPHVDIENTCNPSSFLNGTKRKKLIKNIYDIFQTITNRILQPPNAIGLTHKAYKRDN